MKKSLIAVALAIAVLGAGAVAAKPATASTHVVCATNDYGHWRTMVHPHNCNLHVRNECWCHAGLALFRSAHWAHWGKRHAVAGGKESFNGGVTSHEQVKLFRPRWGRTPWTGSTRFFSRAHIKNRFASTTIKLDVPQGRWLP